MILAFDTHYLDGKAKTVCLAFHDWTDEAPAQTFTETSDTVAEYEPGAFYKRELPCITSLLSKIDVPIDLIVIDGFAILDDDNRYGLGGYLYDYLHKRIPVIGVAKTNYAQNKLNKRAICRGESRQALYITALGIDLDAAAEQIKSMHGAYRIPALLKLLDRLTKE